MSNARVDKLLCRGIPHVHKSLLQTLKKFFSDIEVPKVISLCVRIGKARFGDAEDLVADFCVAGGRVAKLFPVIKPAARDYVVDGSKCPAGMVQVTMQHASRIIAAWWREDRECLGKVLGDGCEFGAVFGEAGEGLCF
jgi:hypothetical protein